MGLDGDSDGAGSGSEIGDMEVTWGGAGMQTVNEFVKCLVS